MSMMSSASTESLSTGDAIAPPHTSEAVERDAAPAKAKTVPAQEHAEFSQQLRSLVRRGGADLPERITSPTAVEWDDILREAQARVASQVPDLDRGRQVGIQEVASAVGLSLQQIRLLERHGLVTPRFEGSGDKRNRRYDATQVVLVAVAAILMHRLHARPAQAAMLIAGRVLGATDAPHAQARRTRHPRSASSPAPRDTPAETHDQSQLNAAKLLLNDSVRSRLKLIAASSLLGQQCLPARWIIVTAPEDRTHLAGQVAGDSRDASPWEPDERDMGAAPRSEGARLISVPVTRLSAPPTPSATNSAEDSFANDFTFVAAGGEIFNFQPTNDVLTWSHDWFAFELPGAGDRKAIRVSLGVPHGEDAPHMQAGPAQYLASGQLRIPYDVAEVAAQLLWAADHVIPRVMQSASEQIEKNALSPETLAEREGIKPILLWLYAQVLAKMCPHAEQCDILAPPRETAGAPATLELIASSNLDQLRSPTRASIRIGQLLTGYSFHLAQSNVVRDASGARAHLLSFQRREQALSAATIAVLYDEKPLAAVYLFAHDNYLDLSIHTQRALEVLASEVAEVLRRDDTALAITAHGISDVRRQYELGTAEALRADLQRWVADVVATPSTGRLAEETQAEDRRFVAVVFGGSLGQFGEAHPDAGKWLLQWSAEQAAYAFARSLDATLGLAGEAVGERVVPVASHAVERHGGVPAVQGAPGTPGARSALLPSTRVFSWDVPATEDCPATRAYVVVAGWHLSRHHIEQLKALIRERGLDGTCEARTEGNEIVGRLYAWVLDTKRAFIHWLISRTDTNGAPISREEMAHAIEQLIANDIDSCARLLPYVHLFHQQAFKQGNMMAAIDTLSQAVRISANNVYVVRHLMDLYVRVGNPERALAVEAEYRQTHDTMPAKMYCALAQAQLMLNNLAEAAQALEQATERDATHPLPHRLMAEVCMAEEGEADLEKAVKCLERAISLERRRSAETTGRVNSRQIVDMMLMLADVLEKQQKVNEAREVYERLLYSDAYAEVAKDNVLLHQRLLAIRRRQFRRA